MANVRIGYLGPEGSFSHEAVSTMEGVDAVACDTLADLLASVADATLDQGLVPIENAIEGTVSATIDGLVFDHDLIIVQEIVIPIRLHLLARPGVVLTDVTNVRSYVHALAQCRAYLHDLDVTIEQTLLHLTGRPRGRGLNGAVGRGRLGARRRALRPGGGGDRHRGPPR